MLISRNSPVRTDRAYYEKLARAGWQAVDMNEFADPALFDRPDASDVLRERIDDVRASGLTLGQCHAPMPLPLKDQSKEALALYEKRTLECVRIAGLLKVPYVVFHPYIYSWSEDADTTDETMAFLEKAVKTAVGTTVCLENMPGIHGFVKTGADLKRFTDAIPGLCVCYDTGHGFSLEEKASSFFAAVGDKIRVLHVHDTHKGLDRHLLPYTGIGDWADFTKTLKDYGYKGTMNSESNFAANAPEKPDYCAFEASVYRRLADLSE